MKKLILFAIVFLVIIFPLSPKADAQTREECDKTRARASYNCLTGWTKCYYPCVDQTKDVSSCYKTCKQSEDACDKQVDVDYQACLAAISKSKPDSSIIVEESTEPNTQTQPDCYSSYTRESTTCQDGANACYVVCQSGPSGDYWSCMESCTARNTACGKEARAELDDCENGVEPATMQPSSEPPAVTTERQPEKPQGVVSSKDLRNILRAINEEQHAQAELEKVKKAQDPRYEAKKDFASEYKAALEEEFIPIKQEDKLKILRGDLEQIKKYAETYSNVKDFTEYLREGKFGPSSRVGTASTVGDGVITYLELLEKGVSQEDAISKSVIDTVAIGSFNALPPLKAAELVATLPDDIMGGLGVSKNHWSRKPTVYLKDNSPSAFVELTTDTMIQTKNWTNVGGALEVAWEDFKSAEGVGGKAKATLDLAGTAVGAVPVAIAMRTRDQIAGVLEAVKFGASGAGQVISGWFTWPD